MFVKSPPINKGAEDHGRKPVGESAPCAGV